MKKDVAVPEETTDTDLPKQRLAPSGVRQNVYGRDLRKEQLDALDKANPEFVHMYQAPGLITGDKKIAWEAESKGQEIVRDESGAVLHHMGDPVVRMRREQFGADREFEAKLSRSDVEAVVKPSRSTVHRNRKKPVEAVEKQ